MKGGIRLMSKSNRFKMRLSGENCEKIVILKNVASIQIQKVVIYDS